MKTRLACAAAAAVLFAAPLAAHAQLEESLKAVAEGRLALASAKPVGAILHLTLHFTKTGFSADPGQTEPLVLSTMKTSQGSQPRIWYGPTLAGASARHAAVLLAEPAARLQLSDMAASAERDYMLSSLAARVYIELGGKRKDLPMFDGRKDVDLAKRIEAWYAGTMDSFVRDAQNAGRPTLVSLLAAKDKTIQEKKLFLAGVRDRLKTGRCASDEHSMYRQIAELEKEIQGLENESQSLLKQQERARLYVREQWDWMVDVKALNP